jgi:hypothetical protein
MKILLLGYDDDANVASDLSRALNSVGHDAQAYASGPHPLAYRKEAIPLVQIDKSFANDADIVDYYNSHQVDLPDIDLTNKPVVVQHGGSRYRRNFQDFNTFWNPLASATVLRTGDLWTLGASTANNPVHVIPPIDTDYLQPRDRSKNKKLVIGHFPTNPSNKGTYLIIKQLHDLLEDPQISQHLELRTRNRVLPWKKHISEVAACDVIIDGVQPTIEGLPYGEPGVASREAASLGCGVITHHAHKSIYESVYGQGCPYLIANDSTTLKTQLLKVSSMSSKHLHKWQEQSREWVVSKHSYKPTAERYIKEVYSS